MKYPAAKKVDTVDVYFGTKVPDPYRWLENENSPETKTWIKAENKLTQEYLAKIPYREKIEKQLTHIWNYEKYSGLYKKSGNYFYFYNNGLQNQNVLFRLKSLGGKPDLIIDPNTFSKNGDITLASYNVSDNGKYIAYSTSEGGSDWRKIFIRDINSGHQLGDTIKWAKFTNISWYKNGFFYSRYAPPEKGKEYTSSNNFQKVYYHKLGTLQKDDKLIYSDTDPQKLLQAVVSHDEKYLFIRVDKPTEGQQLFFKDLDNKKSDFKKIIDGHLNEFFIVTNIGPQLYVVTNQGAPMQQLVRIDLDHPDVPWKVILPENDMVLQDAVVSGDQIIAHYMKDAYSVLDRFDMNGIYLAPIDIPKYGTVGDLRGQPGDSELFFSYSSYLQPSTTYKYDIRKNEEQVIFAPKLNVDLSNYETQLVFYRSKDSTRIPLYLVHKKGIHLDGQNPTLLYGYGGFNISETPNFDINHIIWLENGGIYAVANIRGGGEYGEAWHEAGTKLHKQNVFDDFIAAAEYLIKEDYTSPEHLAIEGRSNGGLLIGAVVNQRPELFRVAIPTVGVMDMLRYQKFTIGWAWEEDYGTSDDSVQFKNLYSYSPLQNIHSGIDYPSILVIASDRDDRVVPGHSFKYIATLQAKYKGDHPVLIRIETNSGHSAWKPTLAKIKERTDVWSFIFHELGVTPQF